MNKSYQIVWNHARNCLMAVSEVCKSRGKSASSKKIVIASVAVAVIALGVGQAMAATIDISSSSTVARNLNAGDALIVESGGSLTTGGNAVSVNGVVSTGVVSGSAISGANGSSIFNAGTISSNNFGVYVYNSTIVGSIVNNGTIQSNSTNALSLSYNTTLTGGITNTGSILGLGGNGILFEGLSIPGGIINTGTISGTGSDGLLNFGTISYITNTGAITGPAFAAGINNFGTITTLNNLQGAGSGSGALTYSGTLPTNYNIIINSPSQYGQLSGTSVTGSTTFGVYNTSTLAKGTYTAVLSGLTSSNLTGATTGTYSGLAWTLALESGSTTIWDLIVGSSGPSTADTQQSLVNTAASLQNIYTLQNSVLANSFSYDCNTFGENNVCVSAGGRNTAVSSANGLNNTSGLLIAAYRPHPNYRIGAYADQNLSVNNAGSTVNLGNNTPLIGLFGAWNERLDGTGTEVKVSAAYGQKNTTITRSVVGTSEAGSGGSQLNSQGAQITAKYGFAVTDNTIVSPYAGVRYTQNNMGGYTESTSSAVTAPLTYSALNTNATTALAGVGAQYKGIPQTTLFASAGVESDTNTQNGSINATGVTGLTPVNFNGNPVKTRPTAMLGASYDVAKNQRLGITGIYRQEAYQATASTTVMAAYTVGL